MAKSAKASTGFGVQEDRLKRSLSLGLRPHSSGSHDRRGPKIWWNTDAQVQIQAVKAIQAFLSAHKFKLQSIEKGILEDIISALEGLLKAESELVYDTAAEIAAALLHSGGVSGIGTGFQGLYDPLKKQLFSTKSSTVTSSANALRFVIANLQKSRAGAAETKLFKSFQDSSVLSTMASRLQRYERFDGEGIAFYVAVADLISTALQCWPAERFGLGNQSDFRKSLYLQCGKCIEDVCGAALRLCASLALCGGVALMQIGDKEALISCLVSATIPSRSYHVRGHAFHFLYILSGSANLTASIESSSLEIIILNITAAISEGLLVTNTRWPQDVKHLVLEACRAALGLLRFPGNHLLYFWRAGFVGGICRLLLELYDTGEVSNCAHAQSINTKSVKYDRDIGPILWEVFSWFSINAPSTCNKVAKKEQEILILRTLEFACIILLMIADRRVLQAAESKHIQDHCCNGLEGVLICKTVLFCLFSSSSFLASAMKQALHNYLQQHSSDWIPSFISKLSLMLSSNAASENMMTIMSLITVCCLSMSEFCRHNLIQQGILDVLVEAVKVHANSVMSNHTACTSTGCLFLPNDMVTCCCEGPYNWEGNNPILFFTLWSFANLAQGSTLAKSINIKLKKQFDGSLNWDNLMDEDVSCHLVLLASSRNEYAGLRLLASRCLACCGLFGFPSEGNNLRKMFNDLQSADLKLIFSDGRYLYAHKVIIASKCPDLLAVPSDKKGTLESKDNNQNIMELHLSVRIHQEPMEALLEFMYAGYVFIDEELVPEVKLLAKRCHMDNLFWLLQGKSLPWGTVPGSCDFTTALGDLGCDFADIAFEDKDHCQVGCVYSSEGIRIHQHAHRVILSAQCHYFEGLFRSGMEDSFKKVIKIPLGICSIKLFLHYLYSSSVPCKPPAEAGCMWSFLPRTDQMEELKTYMELAHLSEQWLLEDLNQQSLTVVLRYLEKNVHLVPEMIKIAADFEQWRFVEAAIEYIARLYPTMRDSGELDVLDEYLIDVIRVAHVKLSMNSQSS